MFVADVWRDLPVKILSHMLHVWYICQHLPQKITQMWVHVPYMEHMGLFLQDIEDSPRPYKTFCTFTTASFPISSKFVQGWNSLHLVSSP